MPRREAVNLGLFGFPGMLVLPAPLEAAELAPIYGRKCYFINSQKVL
jgi:hypothetical protein